MKLDVARERLIQAAYQSLIEAKDRKARVAACAQLTKLTAQRSKAQIARMEEARGLR